MRALPDPLTGRASLAPVAPLPNCPDRVRVYEADTGRRLLLPCRRRVCAYCGPVHWRPKALAGFHAGIGVLPDEYYLTFTLTAPGDAPYDWNDGASERWHNFMTILRREYPKAKIEFWRVAELQKRGFVHFHVLLRGLRFLPARKLRGIQVAVGFGPRVWIARAATYKHGARGAGLYFGKYLLKAYDRTLGGVTRLVTCSNGWRVNWVSRVREPSGKWLYAGPMGAGWRLIGWEVPPGRSSALPRAAPPWWHRSWQSARAAWASSGEFWSLTDRPPVPDAVSAATGGVVFALVAPVALGRDIVRSQRWN